MTILAVARLRSGETGEQMMNILNSVADNTSDAVMKRNVAPRRVTDDADAAVLNVTCLNLIFKNRIWLKL